jgi:predicted transcriptional regulator
VALVFDNHDGEFLLGLAGIAIVKHARRYEKGRFKVNLAGYSKFQGHLVGMLLLAKGGIRMPDDQPTAPANRELAARIVAAYVRRNQVGFDQIPALISTVHQALAGLGKPEAKEVGPRIPAVSLRQSVRPDYLVCLDCGRRSKMLRRHLVDAHGLSTDEYRKRWNLRSDYPMVAPAYSERRSGLAKQFGLGRGGRQSTASDGASKPETST